jgi:L-lysine 6-transaminase
MTLGFQQVIPELKKHILVDGFRLVVDLEKSKGSHLFNGLDNQPYLDFFSFFASLPLGFNHPKLQQPEFLRELMPAALTKPSNSDVYSPAYAEFVETFHRVCVPAEYPYSFYIEGGALAVENALKVAFDWKVRKNLAKGKGERGQWVLHFKDAFHGRSGYTLSLTNTASAEKTAYFPKFGWPRVTNPKIAFPIDDPKNLELTEQTEVLAKKEITELFDRHPDDIACIIIEPVQGEGGDNYFRHEFLSWLRQTANEREALLIFDEVQTGFGASGNWWAFQKFNVQPDICCFGKKTQVCGIFVNRRIEDVDHCFKVSSRINSTFGGNLVDMIRCKQFIRIIEDEQTLAHAKEIGPRVVQCLKTLERKYPQISQFRHMGTWVAFDLPDAATRNTFYDTLMQKHRMVVLKCGTKSIRMRTALNLPYALIDEGAQRIEGALKDIF